VDDRLELLRASLGGGLRGLARGSCVPGRRRCGAILLAAETDLSTLLSPSFGRRGPPPKIGRSVRAEAFLLASVRPFPLTPMVALAPTNTVIPVRPAT